jgi:hypothetical protein
MGLFRRRSKAAQATPGTGGPRDAKRATIDHFKEFTATRVGVEAYIEPPTNQTQTTLLLIATTGEWTRRKVPDAKQARQVAADLGIPVYDVNFTGYPDRMRKWDQARREGRVHPVD